ncbi:MAG: hypothetical protein ABEJ89_08420 [Haloarculaceae archaeon]
MLGDFTYDAYRDLIDAALAADYEFLTVREYLAREDLPERFVVMRHDVDRKPDNALDMALIESAAGVSTSYYFRSIDKTFDPGLLRAIEAEGHEVGYHYEDLDRADGDSAAAHESFAETLDRFREAVTVDTVAMHGNPLTPHDNRDMWADRSFDEYDLLGEVYLSVDFTDVTYFSDTNRTWYDERTVVNDWPVGESDKPVQVASTGDLIDLIEARRFDRLYLLAHPNRWADSYPELLAELAKDAAINLGKWGLWNVRRLRGETPRERHA